VMELAPQFPNNVFVALASPPKDQKFNNVWFSLSEYEGGYYIVGALAAKMTKSNTIGYVGGRENPLYKACSKAYEEGAKSVNPNIRVLSVFTGDFNDPVKAKEATVSQIQSGADVIAHLQSLGMSGVFAAAEESTKAGKKVWVIGKDNDQFSMAPNVVLTSLVIDYAVQMKGILGEIAAGKKTGSLPQSVTNSAVYLADFYGRVPPDIATQISTLTDKVRKGEVKYTTQYDIQ
jgi:basic membrane protein A and related proteins